jgi:hypothetical protein
MKPFGFLGVNRRHIKCSHCHSRGGIVKNILSTFIGGCVFTIAIALAHPCYGQQKYSYSHSSPPEASRYIHDYSIEVDDVPGHKVRIVEIQRTYSKDHPIIMGTKVIEMWFRGFTDYGSNGGPGHGYETWILEDGNRLFCESIFISSTEASATGSRKGTSTSTLRFVGGSGKYASIRGNISSSVEFDNDPKTGYNRPSSKGEYWFSEKNL